MWSKMIALALLSAVASGGYIQADAQNQEKELVKSNLNTEQIGEENLQVYVESDKSLEEIENLVEQEIFEEGDLIRTQSLKKNQEEHNEFSEEVLTEELKDKVSEELKEEQENFAKEEDSSNLAEDSVVESEDGVKPENTLIEESIEEIVDEELEVEDTKLEEAEVEVTPWRDGFIVSFENEAQAEIGFKELKDSSDIKFSQEVYGYELQSYAPNDPLFGQMWQYQDQPSGNYAQSAWSALSSRYNIPCGQSSVRDCGGDQTVRVGIIDTGINPDVSDLNGMTLDTAASARYYKPSSNVCPEGELFFTDTRGGSSSNICKTEGSQFDDDNHGTMVASLIAAQDNATGFVGIANNITLVSAAIHGASTFNTITVSDSIYHLTDRGVDVINMSIGGTGNFDSVLETAVNYAAQRGVIVVTSAGNEAQNGNPTVYPAAFSNTIAVGASNYATSTTAVNKSIYSSFGSYIDVVAPVGDSQSEVGKRGILTQDKDGIIAFAEGTSWAAPQVTASVALMKAFRRDLGVGEVRSILAETSQDLGSAGKDDQFGYGLLRVNELITSTSLAWEFQRGRTPSTLSIVDFRGTWYQMHKSATGREMFQNTSTDQGITWSPWERIQGYTSVDPMMFVLNDRLWQTHQSAEGYLFSRYSDDGVNWVGWTKHQGISFHPLSMTYFDDTVYQVHRGSQQGLMFIRYSFDNGDTWTGWNLVPGQTNTIPVLGATEDTLWMAHTGLDGYIYTRFSTNGTQWSNWQRQNGYTKDNLFMYSEGSDTYIIHTGFTGTSYYTKPLLRDSTSNKWNLIPTIERAVNPYAMIVGGQHILTRTSQRTWNLFLGRYEID